MLPSQPALLIPLRCGAAQTGVCVTYFSISLFLHVRGAEEDDGVLGSVLLLSPLLVEGISVTTGETHHKDAIHEQQFRTHRAQMARLHLPSLAHLENSGVILLEGIPPLQERQMLT